MPSLRASTTGKSIISLISKQNVDFMKLLLKKEKDLILLKDVKLVKVPEYPEVSQTPFFIPI